MPYSAATAEELRALAVAEELLALGVELQPTELPSRAELGLIVAISARATSVFEASLWLCRGGFFGQAEILNRVLFEDMASAHWIVAEPQLALERIRQHEQLEDILWRDVATRYSWLVGSTTESPFQEQLPALQKVFGDFGHKHWTGLGMYALVVAIESQWPEGRPRDQLWMYWRIGQRRNSSQVHGGAGPYGDAARHLFGGELTENPGFVGAERVGGPLASALWIYGQVLSLILDQVDDASRARFDDVWARVNAVSAALAERAAAGE